MMRGSGRRSIVVLLLVLVANLAATPASAHHSFDDVSHEDQFHADIEALAASGITRGCDERTFCPTANVTRGQMAAFLRRALTDVVTVGTVVEFTDDDESEFEGDIEWLASTGITKGCGGTNFCPNDPVTRGQMAAFLERALRDVIGPVEPVAFSDDDDSIFEMQIEWLAGAGITKGCGGTAFCPNDRVTREQMAAFLKRALSLPPNPLLGARLEGAFDIVFTVVTSDGFEEVGDTYDLVADYLPNCSSGPCATTDDQLNAVYQFMSAAGTYHAGYDFTADCVDGTGALVMADAYMTEAVEVIWAVALDGSGLAAVIAGEAVNSYQATSAAIAAGCDESGVSTYRIDGTVRLDRPTLQAERRYQGVR